ncbi:uncharacterized protein LOC124661197 [Lolium rigidum]|uniref:uncharacterized protein LOC124661197 n=1 Tax=Lolium rigidum TaxID=89674 RepID=UPI001F5CE862|nr:uncharacterized protein LOC124661197 [Lolium rigidum]
MERPATQGGRRPDRGDRSEEGSRHRAITAMELLSCVGRVLFASFFIISAYREACKFGSDGGPAAKSLEPKFNLFLKQVSTNTGMAVPHIHIKTVTTTTLFLKGYGGGFLILNLSLGAFLLLVYLAFITPVMCDFYNYEMGSPQFVQLFTQFSQNLALCGALLFFIGMKSSIPWRKSKRRAVKTKTT